MRAAVDRCQEPDRGAGAAGPHLGFGARQSSTRAFILTDPAPPERFPDLSFVAALALHDAIGGRIPGLSNRLVLKWPNDLLIDRNKFAGILIEGERTSVAIGIGVNCVHHPGRTDYPATDLATACVRTTPESLFAPLSAAMVARLAQWNRGAGFAAIRTELAGARRGRRQAYSRQIGR
jgi:BirA family biotin operon repressor/biotin-[acetyl-CoA-carboxylase] ligase